MKLMLETAARSNLIRGYSDQEIIIGETRVTRSCLLSATELITEWPPASFAQLELAHLEGILEHSPQLLLIGTGATQRFAPAALRSALAQRGVGVEAMALGAACRTFNVLVQEERRVAAALFLA